MIADARELTAEVLEADICIIGAGPAGITLAHALRDAGRRVLLLESGGMGLDRPLQALNEGELAQDTLHPPVTMYRQRRIGGASAIWGGRCVPYEPIDFEARPGLHDGWPIPYEEVAELYPEAMAYCEAGPADFDARTALDPSRSLIEGFDDPAVKATNLERFSRPTHFGRRWLTDLQASAAFKGVTYATALRVVRAPDSDRIDHVACAVEDRRFLARAKVFVVAVGGLETVRLLGASGLGGPKLGLGYMCHVEGTFGTLELTPNDRAVSWGFERTDDGVYCRRRLSLDPAVQREKGLLNFVCRLHHENVVDPGHGQGVLSLMYLAKSFIIPEYRRKLATIERKLAAAMPTGAAFWGRHIGNVAVDGPRVAGFALDWVRRRHLEPRQIPYVVLPSRRGRYPLEYNAEQVPDDLSRVGLADSLDRYDVPRLTVDWRATEADFRSVAETYRLMRDAFARSGVGRLHIDEENLEQRVAELSAPVGGHHIGTARMAASPARGVVDGHGQVHGTQNLYVLGAATFPTSSHANPTLTIVAMALRLAARLRTI